MYICKKNSTMNCPKCSCSNFTKDGFANKRPRHRCKNCNYRYSVVQKSDVKSAETRRMALELYLEGMGFRAIGRVLKISYGTVYQWVKKWGEEATLVSSTQAVEVIELDELHTYIGSKKTTVGSG